MSTITVESLEIPHDVHTLEGFRVWAAGLGEHAPRIHFYKGNVFIEMSPQDYFTHGRLVEAINLGLANLVNQQSLGQYHLPPSWLTVPGTRLSTEPDGFFVLWERLQCGEVQVNPERPTELLGAPTMALEVVSKSSKKKDLKDLVAAYAKAGVQEYWIADAGEDPLIFRILVLKDGAYRDQSADGEGWVASPLFHRSFRIERFTNPAGLTDYRLHQR